MSKADPKGIWRRLDEMAKYGLTVDFGDWPGDPVDSRVTQASLAAVEHLARSILRLYAFRPTDGLTWETPWAWVAMRNDHSGWRPIDPDWQPDPFGEWPTCRPQLDPAPLKPDLRPAAFELLYWVFALRASLERQNSYEVMRAAWRTQVELAELRIEFDYGRLLDRAIGHNRGSTKGGNKTAEMTKPMKDQRIEAFNLAMTKLPDASPERLALEVVATQKDLWKESKDPVNAATTFCKRYVKARK